MRALSVFEEATVRVLTSGPTDTEPDIAELSDICRSASHFTPAKLEAFVAVAEEGGVSAASRRLHISQPALSQTINALERQLRVKLLERSNTGVRTTPQGVILLAEARAFLAHHDRMLRALTDSSQGGIVISVCIPAELNPAVLQALAKFAADPTSPHVRVRHLSLTEQLAELRSGALDLSLTRERPVGPDFDSMLLTQDALGVLVSADLGRRLAGPDGIRLGDLGRLQWIRFARSNSPRWYDEVTAVLRSHGIDHAGSDELLPIASVVCVAVSGGRSFALAPESWANPIPDEVTWHPLVGAPLMRRTWLVWPASSRRRDVADLITALETAV